ncbi:hypothetical protein F5883DRAFT_255673 [Diaporthe sp. PMI_573]|nr:hypothetical protein F5883DRAFT_255673 [Diaporthaceae sp. PMI_573]
MHAQMALGLSSYILSALGTEDLKYSEDSALIAAQLGPIVESLGRAQSHKSANHAWYICASFRESETPAPDFLGVAIDFDLTAYLRKALTAQALRDKRGLSVLIASSSGGFPTTWALTSQLETASPTSKCSVAHWSLAQIQTRTFMAFLYGPSSFDILTPWLPEGHRQPMPRRHTLTPSEPCWNMALARSSHHHGSDLDP